LRWSLQQIDADGSDADSSLGDLDRAYVVTTFCTSPAIRAHLDRSSSTNMSVTPSTYEFVEEFGRTFHKYKEGSQSHNLPLEPWDQY